MMGVPRATSPARSETSQASSQASTSSAVAAAAAAMMYNSTSEVECILQRHLQMQPPSSADQSGAGEAKRGGAGGGGDQAAQKRKRTTHEDPMSHRIIEKRRRDRMNNCLADLSRLIPSSYLKKGRGRIEKTEIIEMAIKHMKHLQTQAGKNTGADPPAGTESDSSSSMSQNIESFRVGYHECLSETMHFLVEREGMYAGDSLCVRMMNHLQRHYERINRGTPLGRADRTSSTSATAAGASSAGSSSGYAANGSSNSGSDTGVSANSSELNVPVDSDYGSARTGASSDHRSDRSSDRSEHRASAEHRVPIIGLQTKTEQTDNLSAHEQSMPRPSSTPPPRVTDEEIPRNSRERSKSETEELSRLTTLPEDSITSRVSDAGGQYKFKASIQQRFSHQAVDDLRTPHHHLHHQQQQQQSTPTPEKKLRLDSPLDLMIGHRRSGFPPLQSPFQHEPREVKSPSLDPESDPLVGKYHHRIESSQFSPSPSFKYARDIKVARSPSPAVSTSSHPAPVANVPVFALHPKGTFYIPLTVDYSIISPYMLLYPDGEAANHSLHPVTISVNFCGPLQVAMKLEPPTPSGPPPPPPPPAPLSVAPAAVEASSVPGNAPTSSSVARHLRQTVAEYAPSWRERIDQVMIERTYQSDIFGRSETKPNKM